MDELKFAINFTNNSGNAVFDDLDRRIASTEKNAAGMSSSFSKGLRDVAGAVAVTTGALATMVGAATAVWKVTADNIDAQNKLATSLGLTYGQYERLAYAAGIAGTSTESMNSGLKKLSVGLADALDGTGPAADAIKALGLEANNLANMPLDQALQQVSAAMQGIENQTDRSRIVVSLFGREGLALMPLLTSDMQGLGDEAERMGRTLASVDLAAIDSAGDAFDRVASSLSAVTNRFAADLAPAMQVVAEELFGLTGGMGEFGGAGTIAADLVTNSIAVVIDIFTVLKGAVQIVTAAVMTFGAFGVDVFTGLIAGINAFWIPFQTMINGWVQIHNLIFKDEQWPLLGDLEKAVDSSAEFAKNMHGAAGDLGSEGAGNIAKGLTGEAGGQFKDRVDAARAQAAQDAAAGALTLGGEAQGIGGTEAEGKEGKGKKTKSADDWEADFNQTLEQYEKEAAAENARYAQKQEQAQAYLDQIAQNGMSELELLAVQHEEKQAKLGELRQQELITQDEFNAAMVGLDEAYQAKKVQTLLAGNASLQSVSKAFQKSELQGTIAFFAQGLEGLTGNSKKMFEVSKAAKLAQAALTLPETVMNAYNAGMIAGGPAGPAVGAAYAAVALATQIAQIRAIQSSSFGGGASAGAVSGGSGGGGGASAGGGGNAAPAAPQRFVNINLGGDDSMYSKATVRGLIERINTEVKDGAVLGVS